MYISCNHVMRNRPQFWNRRSNALRSLSPRHHVRKTFRTGLSCMSALTLLVVAVAQPAHAQACGTKDTPAPTLTAGQTIRGSLAREDATLPGDRYNGTDPCTGRPFDSFFYEAVAGERLTFVVESRRIDPSITATTQWRGGGSKDVVEQRGRRGRTLTATGTVPAAGRILIQVESNVSLGRRGSTGDYSFTLRSERPANAPAPRPAPDAAGGSSIRSGQTVQGELTSASGKLADDSHFQDYTYQARRGEKLVAGLTSDDFDAFLHVGRRIGDGTLENVVSDDDGGGGTNSLVEYVADQDGPVTIRVNTLSAGETGSYSLEVYSTGGDERAASEPEQPAAPIQGLRAGQAVRGELARGDATMDDGSWYDHYTYTARRGERIVVRMESDEFDTVLGVSGREDAADLVMDDDGGGGTNSRVEYTATADGPILIRANALSAGEGGSYTLVIESARRSALPMAGRTERLAATAAAQQDVATLDVSPARSW
jgi:hypothetical protein